MEKLIKEWKCKEHNESYSSYCLECDKGYCALCSIDEEEHKITPLFKTVELEELKELMEREESLIMTLDNKLRHLVMFQEFVVSLMESNKNLCTLLYQTFVALIRSMYMKYLKVIEENVLKQLENIKTIYMSCQRMRLEVEERFMSIKQIRKDYDIGFNHSYSEAYMAIKKYKQLKSVTPKKEQINELLEDLDAKIISSIKEIEILNPEYLEDKAKSESRLHEINFDQISSSIKKAGEQFNDSIGKMIKDLECSLELEELE